MNFIDKVNDIENWDVNVLQKTVSHFVQWLRGMGINNQVVRVFGEDAGFKYLAKVGFDNYDLTEKQLLIIVYMAEQFRIIASMVGVETEHKLVDDYFDK